MPDRVEDFQAEVLYAYTLLFPMRQDWPGSLILSCGLGPRGAALAVAANVAGAAFLGIDEHPEVCRAAMRSGACDFAVNTVDEALRILKNQIRQRKAIGVALELSPNLALTELLDRGVLPQLFSPFNSDSNTGDPALQRAVRALQSLGTQIIQFLPVDSLPPESFPGSPAPTENHRQMHTFPSASAAELRAFDARALAILPSGEQLRRNWLLAAPRLFPRDRHRVLWLSEAEYQQLTTGN
jgi:urocanate hydratase